MEEKIEIKKRLTGEVIFSASIDCEPGALPSVKLGLAVRLAIKSRANLGGADLSRANLNGADLGGADLRGADLGGANLSSANLRGAYLSGADLSRANLGGANLRGADLGGADLSRANLGGANLNGADLGGANLNGADLGGAYLSGAYLVDGGQRSDGYRFVGWVKDSILQIRAGCRNFSIDEARAHWLATRAGTPLGDETICILDHIEAVAKIRKLI